MPVHDADTGVLIGAIDLTGGSLVATPQALALVRATVVAVENHLALLRLTGPSPHGFADRGLDFRLVLLSRHPEGLSADHLALPLDDKDLDVVTVRAEMSRLSRVIGPELIGSRPYRLLAPITSDVGAVFDALEAGDVESALAQYSGQLLR